METQKQLAGLRAPIPIASKYLNFARFINNPVDMMTKGYERFGNLFSLYPAETEQMIVVIGSEHIRTLLQDTELFHIASDVGANDDYIKALTCGLPLMNGDEHRHRRRLMMPAFHRKYIDNYRDDMVDITHHMLDSWEISDARDIRAEMKKVALKIAVKTLLGGESDEDKIGDLLRNWVHLTTNPLSLLLKFDIAGLPYHDFKTISKDLFTQLEKFIAYKRDNLGYDILSTLIQARDEDGNGFDERELIGQANVLFFAGHETTANAMTWTLFLLAQHPQVMAKLQDELAHLNGEPPTIEQLNDLSFLEAVIKESMRLLPPTPYSIRVSQDAFELGGYSFAKYTVIWFGNYITHRLPAIYDDPLKFMPERWEAIKPTAYEYMPFHTGARMCLGAPFAMMEMKIVLCMIMQRFRLTSVPDSRVDYKVRVTLQPKNPLTLQIHRQDSQPDFVPVKGNIHTIIDLPKAKAIEG